MAAYYWDQDNELDIRIHQGHSPSRYDRVPRYMTRSGQLLEVAQHRRTRSRERRSPSPAIPLPPPAPVIINNRIDNRFDEDYEDDARFLPIGHHRRRSSSRHYQPTPAELGWKSPGEWEQEQLIKDFQRQRLADERAAHDRALQDRFEREVAKKAADAARAEADYKKRLADEIDKKRRADEDEAKELKMKIELEIAKQEKKAEDDKARKKKEKEDAIAEYKAKEAKKAAEEKAAKELFEKEYQDRVEKDLRRVGMNEQQIATVIKNKEEPGRPTYTRMSLRWLEIETLSHHRIDWTYDTDREYILIRRWVPEWEQDILWNHTRQLRERHRPHAMAALPPPPPPAVVIIDPPRRRGSHKKPKEYQYQIVRKERRGRSPGLISFLAGGR